MPVALPEKVTSVVLFQIRMIPVIMGYELKSDQIQTFVYATLAGTSVSNIVKKSGIAIGNKMKLGLVKKNPKKCVDENRSSSWF